MRITPYNRTKAVDYAHRWAYGRNPAYYNFDGIGGDCTNFTSQCIYGGDAVMNYSETLGWYYTNPSRRSASWTGVEFLHYFIMNNQGVGPFAAEVTLAGILPGDFVQLRFNAGRFQHSPFVVSVGSPATYENVLVAAHTYDTDYQPLSTYHWAGIRFIHILGIRR
jgi:hypothetical protein